MVKYQTSYGLNLDFYPQLLDSELATLWFNYLKDFFPDKKKRHGLFFGNPDIIYTVKYKGTDIHRKVLSWSEIPGLWELKTLVEKITHQKYTACVIQCYPSGKYGIAPHRDKEMIPGTCISGLSLGATRTLEFREAWNTNSEPIQISLPHGSLYVMNSPTNQKYTHSILKDSTIMEERISLTFRDY